MRVRAKRWTMDVDEKKAASKVQAIADHEKDARTLGRLTRKDGSHAVWRKSTHWQAWTGTQSSARRRRVSGKATNQCRGSHWLQAVAKRSAVS